MANINDVGFPFRSDEGDRQYSSDEWREYFKNLFSDGVMSGINNDLKVKAQAVPNKTIQIDTGAVLIQGAARIISSVINLSLADNTSGNPRIDRIVARLNYTDRKIEFAVIQGTPGAVPVAPALTQTTVAWELSLAQIALANGYSTITNSEITDERSNDTVCGFAKITYMQEYDDENNLLKYDRDVISRDADGRVTEVRYLDSAVLFLKRVYSNADANGYYQTVTETFYLSDGATVYKTAVYTLTYFSDGIIDTSSRVVTLS